MVRLLAIMALAVVMLAGCGEPDQPPSDKEQSKCNHNLPETAVWAGEVSFQEGGNNVQVSPELDMIDNVAGGKSIQDRNVRVGIAVNHSDETGKAIVYNGGDADLVVKTAQECVDRLPAHGELYYWGDVTLQIYYLL